jgi:hypothetical protein
MYGLVLCLIYIAVSQIEAFSSLPLRRARSDRSAIAESGQKFGTDESKDSRMESYTKVPGLENVIRPSITDKARTITHVCTSATLCTTSTQEGVEGSPFGSYVDYILDENGWPVLLLSEQSLHTINVLENPSVSLFAQLPRSQSTQTTAALSRVTVIGKVEPIEDPNTLQPLRFAFTLVHPYAEQIVDSPKVNYDFDF